MLGISLALFVFMACVGGAGAQPADHSRMDHSAHGAAMPGAQRHAGVSERGKDVMAFSLPATTHIFTRTAEGGIQQVVAKDTADATQVQLIRRHLGEIREQFLRGDFSGPTHIHGPDMPGLAELKSAEAGRIAIAYKDVAGGAELVYSTADTALVAALHRWFDAQLSDHGSDARAGHRHQQR